MIRRFTSYRNGVVRLRISGAYPERFINFCMVEHIYLWGVKKQGNDLLGWVSLTDFLRIRPVVRRSKNRVKVMQRYGFPFLFRRWKQRKVLLAGACGFFIALYWLSGSIWFVDIEGAKTVSAEAIAGVVEKQGLFVGARQSDISSKAIEKELLVQIPELAWAGVHFTGTRAVVEIVEKVMPFVGNPCLGNLVASKAGIVTECIALMGEPVVRIGDRVREGDVLIRGIESAGIVKARICYESYGEAPLEQYVYNRTGERDFAIRLHFNENEVILKTAETAVFYAYEVEKIVKKVQGWRNSGLAVELTIDVYHELNVSLVETSIEKAKNTAVLNALGESQTFIPEDAYVVDRSVDLLTSDNPDIVKVKLRIETEEEIGRYIAYN